MQNSNQSLAPLYVGAKNFSPLRYAVVKGLTPFCKINKTVFTMNKYLSLVLCVIALSSFKPATDEQTAESKKVNDFLDKKFDEAVARNPEEASTLGLKINYGDWTDRNDDFAKKELAIAKDNLAYIKSNFKLKQVDAQTALSVKMYEEDIKRNEEGLKWIRYSYDVSQMGGVHDDLPAFLVNVHKIDSASDARAYISRLKKMDKVFDQVIVNLKASETLGVIPPYFTFKYVTDDINGFITGADKTDESNVLLTDFTTKIEKLNIDKAEKTKLETEAATIIKTSVKAAYQKLLDYWTVLEPKAKANGSKGIWNAPHGDDYYNYMLHWHTTTNMTADQVYETGLKEVARIHNVMKVIMKKVNYKNDSLQDFFAFMLSDPQFKYSNDDNGRAKLLADANLYIDSMRVKLPELFGTLPKAPLVVMKVEKFREKSAAGAFYEDPAEDGSRPGRYYVNTYNMNNEPRFQMEALTYHEGIPGHHMQIAIAQELRGIPKFRRHELYTSYVEGWALYCEKLGEQYVLKWADRKGFTRMAMEYGYDIIPVAAVGAEEAFTIIRDANDILNSPFGKFLKFIGVAESYFKNGELMPPVVRGIGGTIIPRPAKLYFSFGKRISTAKYKAKFEDPETQEMIKKKVEESLYKQFGELFEIRDNDTDRSKWRRLLNMKKPR